MSFRKMTIVCMCDGYLCAAVGQQRLIAIGTEHLP